MRWKVGTHSLTIELDLSLNAILEQLVQLLRRRFGGRQKVVHLLDAAQLQRLQQRTHFRPVSLLVQLVQSRYARVGIISRQRGEWRNAYVSREHERLEDGLGRIGSGREPVTGDWCGSTAVGRDLGHLAGCGCRWRRRAQKRKHFDQTERRRLVRRRRGGACRRFRMENKTKVERVLGVKKAYSMNKKLQGSS